MRDLTACPLTVQYGFLGTPYKGFRGPPASCKLLKLLIILGSYPKGRWFKSTPRNHKRHCTKMQWRSPFQSGLIQTQG